MYLVDTNVVSELAPTKVTVIPSVRDWLTANGDRIWISAVSIAEISFGAARLVRRGATEKGTRLKAWVRQVVRDHGDRVLPVNDHVALRAGELMALVEASGREASFEDCIIAATADLHGLIVLTRNVQDFAPTGVAVFDPFTNLPPMPPRGR